MKMKQSFFYTLRENVKDEDSTSGNLLSRAGMIKKTSAGVYMMLPLGFKVLRNIENIIRKEMEDAGSQELIMPALISEDVYIQSGRREGFGNSMFSLNDRFNKPFVLGPTHEELFAMAAQMKIKSYKDLPFSLYQFQTKFRDEPRPRFGLIRVREFIMKDSYTFDADEAGLDQSYKKMFDAYVNSFDKMKLNYKIVKADTGVMGGLLSEEFQAITPIGEDIIVLCDHCDLATNIEIAACTRHKSEDVKHIEKKLIETKNAKSIDEVTQFLNKSSSEFVKTLIYSIDGEPYACLVRGNRDVNETKLRKLLCATEVELASPETVLAVTEAQVGFAGPINIKCPIIMDDEVATMHNFVVGANQTDYHYLNCNLEDFEAFKTADIINICENDACPVCGNPVNFKKGIEIGNTFKLGTKYSQALGLEYSNQENKLNPVWMGSYGIGPARVMAAIAEQHNDENGLVWPVSVAPYQVAVVIISTKDDQQCEVAEELYNKFKAANIEVILDDRDERPGVKFKDLDLIGIPYRVVVGKKINEGQVEFKHRKDGKSEDINIQDVIEHLNNLVK